MPSDRRQKKAKVKTVRISGGGKPIRRDGHGGYGVLRPDAPRQMPRKERRAAERIAQKLRKNCEHDFTLVEEIDDVSVTSCEKCGTRQDVNNAQKVSEEEWDK